MTIQNPKAYVDGLWDWGVLRGCFGNTKIEPTDIDGFVERNGKFLILETKDNGVEIKQGQQLTFNALVKTGLFTIIVIWGNPGNPKRIRVITSKADRNFKNSSLEQLRDIVSQWFNYAEGYYW